MKRKIHRIKFWYQTWRGIVTYTPLYKLMVLLGIRKNFMFDFLESTDYYGNKLVEDLQNSFKKGE